MSFLDFFSSWRDSLMRSLGGSPVEPKSSEKVEILHFKVGDIVVHKRAAELGRGLVTELCPNVTMCRIKWEYCDYAPGETGDWHWNTKLELLDDHPFTVVSFLHGSKDLQ